MTTSPPRRIAPSRLTGLRGSVPRWFISCRNAGPTFRVLPSFLPSFLVSRAGQLPSFPPSLSPFTSPLETSLGGGYFTQSTVRPRISTKSLFWIRFLPPFPIPHVSAALLANLNFFYHKTPLLTRNIRVSRKLKGIRMETSYEKAFRKGRKGLRVTGPMITRARISKRDMPLILSLSRERGEPRFLGPGTRSRGLRIGGGVGRRASPNFSQTRGNNGSGTSSKRSSVIGWKDGGESSPATGEVEFSSCAATPP